MKKLEKMSATVLNSKLTRKEMKMVMAGTGTGSGCKTSFAQCGYMGEGNCGETSDTGGCWCKVGSRVVEDYNCKQ